MTKELTLVLFDMDGTVFDSKAKIISGFRAAFESLGLEAPADENISRTIGLSLELAVAQFAGGHSAEVQEQITEAYRNQWRADTTDTQVPFFDGMRAVIDELISHEHITLGAATGKKRRGLDPLLESNGLGKDFMIRQTPDLHPSKPDPSMILDAMSRFGFDKSRTVMIGDTSFDIDMAHNAGARSIGVSWGYHDQELIDAKPEAMVDNPHEILDVLKNWELL